MFPIVPLGFHIALPFKQAADLFEIFNDRQMLGTMPLTLSTFDAGRGPAHPQCRRVVGIIAFSEGELPPAKFVHIVDQLEKVRDAALLRQKQRSPADRRG